MSVKSLKNVFLLFVIFFVLLGILYPVAVTGVAKLIFPYQASGSLYELNGKIVGSKLICQPVSDPGLFWPRPSSTSSYPCNPLSSGGSNIGPTNKQLVENIESRIKVLNSYGLEAPFPSDMVMGSGSGLESYISLENALMQAKRVSHYSGIPYEELLKMIYKNVDGRTFGIFGEKRVNVVKLNMELLEWKKKDQFQKVY
ncbi:MAG TPA: potassium-transporting ATPase subunit KdpC [Hydrogenobaculum sp.]|nr:potassium-transporting ATPase subunit KdpC [Hydrogenobaculum sp.]